MDKPDEIRATMTEEQFAQVKADMAMALRDPATAASYMAGIMKSDSTPAAGRLPQEGMDAETKVIRENIVAGKGGHATFGSFLKSVVGMTPSLPGTYTGRAFNDGAVMKALNESEGQDGGFLVPEEFRAEILRLGVEGSTFRPRARIIPITGSSVKLPRINETSRATSLYGGVVAYWEDEAETHTASQPTFGSFVLSPKKLVGYTQASNELLSDSAVGLEALISTMFGEALVFEEEEAFLQGSGAGQPLGILNSGALISVTKETGQAAATILYENIVKMWSRLMGSSQARAVWFVNQDTFPQLATMNLAVGTGGVPVFLPAGGVAGNPFATLMGRPLIVTEHAATLGTVGDIVLADLSYYVIGDRQALTVAASPHVGFVTDQMTWRFIQRVDGAPWVNAALTPKHGTNTVSPFVALATRS
jgi:HK97 family phage major capsid protein